MANLKSPRVGIVFVFGTAFGIAISLVGSNISKRNATTLDLEPGTEIDDRSDSKNLSRIEAAKQLRLRVKGTFYLAEIPTTFSEFEKVASVTASSWRLAEALAELGYVEIQEARDRQQRVITRVTLTDVGKLAGGVNGRLENTIGRAFGNVTHRLGLVDFSNEWLIFPTGELQFVEITGITDAVDRMVSADGVIKEVQFKFSRTPNAFAMALARAKVSLPGNQTAEAPHETRVATAFFRRYDDGWRFEEMIRSVLKEKMVVREPCQESLSKDVVRVLNVRKAGVA